MHLSFETYFVHPMYLNPLITAKCETLSNPANGTVTVRGLIQGSIATYTCDVTHKLVGLDTRMCDSNAIWTDVEPVCMRKYTYLVNYIFLVLDGIPTYTLYVSL